MKGASIVVYFNADGEAIDVKNCDEVGNPTNKDPEYGEDEKNKNKKIVGGNYKSKLMYPNVCCWKKIGNVWQCVSCTG